MIARLRFALVAFVRAWRSFDARPTLPPALGPYRAPAPTPALDYVPVHERRPFAVQTWAEASALGGPPRMVRRLD